MKIPADRFPRWAVPASAAALFAALYGLYAIGQGSLYRAVLEAWGIGPYDFPFLDTRGELSAIECWRMGINVYVTNPCDALGWLFDYSPLLLWASVFDLGASDTRAAGLIVDGLFLLSLAALPAPRGRPAMALMLLGVFSTMTVFALERANNDLLIFALAALAGLFLPRVSSARFAGLSADRDGGADQVLSRDAAGLGTARAAPGSSPSSPPPRSRCWRCSPRSTMPSCAPRSPMWRKARISPICSARRICLTASPRFSPLSRSGRARCGSSFIWPPRPARPLSPLRPGCALPASVCRRPKRRSWKSAPGWWRAASWPGQNIGYRGIFLLFALPGLWSLAQAAGSGLQRALFRTAIGSILFLMWGEFFRHRSTIWRRRRGSFPVLAGARTGLVGGGYAAGRAAGLLYAWNSEIYPEPCRHAGAAPPGRAQSALTPGRSCPGPAFRRRDLGVYGPSRPGRLRNNPRIRPLSEAA